MKMIVINHDGSRDIAENITAIFSRPTVQHTEVVVALKNGKKESKRFKNFKCARVYFADGDICKTIGEWEETNE